VDNIIAEFHLMLSTGFRECSKRKKKKDYSKDMNIEGR